MSNGLPNLLPPAGHYLLAGINAVLPLLTSPPLAAPVDQLLIDDLRTALARTAACGDTCRVPEAVDAVRTAANQLSSGSREEARLALLHGRALLTERPAVPRPRGAAHGTTV